MMKRIYAILFVCILTAISFGILVRNFHPASGHSFALTPLSPTPVTVSGPGIPQILVIPKIHVSVPVEPVGKDSEGLMDVPKSIFNTGWYVFGPRPGEMGNAVIDGHFDTPTGAPSVFYNLRTLIPGDTLFVYDRNGKKLIFRVTRVTSYKTNAFPVAEVFGKYEIPRLNLITCGGTWDRREKNYSERVVVFSELIRPGKV